MNHFKSAVIDGLKIWVATLIIGPILSVIAIHVNGTRDNFNAPTGIFIFMVVFGIVYSLPFFMSLVASIYTATRLITSTRQVRLIILFIGLITGNLTLYLFDSPTASLSSFGGNTVYYAYSTAFIAAICIWPKVVSRTSS